MPRHRNVWSLEAIVALEAELNHAGGAAFNRQNFKMCLRLCIAAKGSYFEPVWI